MKNYVKVLIILLFCGSLFGQSKVGTTAANFLTIPVGPRAGGMGGAMVAMSGDASSLYWNAGAVSRLPQSEFNVAYSSWLAGTSYNWASLAFKLGDDDAFGLSINQLDYGEEEITTENQPEGTGQKWKANDIAIGVSYAKNLTDRFSIGGTLKYIRQTIWNESATAFALDIGLLFTTQLDGLRIGMNIANFGTEMQMSGKDLLQPIDIDPVNAGNNSKITGSLNTDSWTLPLNFTVGLGYDAIKAKDWKLQLGVDAVYPNNQTSHLNVGGELIWSNMVALRAGYNSLFKEAADERFSAGVGLQYDFGAFKAKVDFSQTNYELFKDVTRVALTIGF